MKKKSLIFLFFISISNVFNCCDLYGNKELGNRFTLFARDSPEGQYDLIYCARYDIGGCVSGAYVLPTADTKYDMYVPTAKSNDKWIIAKTIQVEDNKENYWIIEKFSLEDIDCWEINCDSIIQSHVMGAFDFIEFTDKTKELGIKLEFE